MLQLGLMVVVSNFYGFIFIKTVKTASTSIEVCLSRILPETDILTPIYPTVPGHFCRNFDLYGKNKLYNHISIREVFNLFGDRISEYQSWCVERNPLDKCLSHYAMLRNSLYNNNCNKFLTWDQYVAEGRFPIDTMKWSDGKNILVDKIFDYASIIDDIPKYLIDVYGIIDFRLNASAKSGFRSNEVPKVSEITVDQKKIIMKAFSISNLLLKTRGIIFD